MDAHVRYRFMKPVQCADGVLKPGDEITIINGRVYFNGGMVMPAFYDFLMGLIKRCETDPNFTALRRVPIPYNKC